MTSSKMTLATQPVQCHQHLSRGLKPELRYTGDNPATWRRKVRAKLRTVLGMPVNERRPLHVRFIWRREHELGAIEKFAFNAEPGADVPAYLCLPRDARPPYRTFICLQGHSTGMHNSIAADAGDERTPIAVEGDRDFAIGCMQRGMAALCIEQRAFGQRRDDVSNPTGPTQCHAPAMHALMLGRTLIGERVFDIDRAIDYLHTRKDIDPTNIGCMGNSSGGTTTMYAMALLDRIACGICSCSFATWRGSIMGVHHCMCNYAPGLANLLDMGDILACAAPKPLVIVNGVKDDIFDIATARSEFRRVKKAYRDAGAAKQCHFVEGPEGHRFYADIAWRAMLGR